MALSHPSCPLTLLGDGLTAERGSAFFRHRHIRAQRDVDLAREGVRAFLTVADNFIQRLFRIRADLRFQLRCDNLGAIGIELSLPRDDSREVDGHGVATRTRAQERHVHWLAGVRFESRHYHIRRR